ncbi:MAG: HAD-IIIA family hydrolase [Chitinophagia bacterium]|nr:HAD-IIIA family hydrolase [Chitinophagia bacterium]
MSDNSGIGAIFLDADGVLWEDIGSGGILSGEDHAIKNLSLLSLITSKQYLKIVISNQTYAARKKMAYARFKLFTYRFFSDLIKQDLIDDYAICYHHPNAKNFFLRKNCKCRKPLPGLINSMVKKHNIIPQKSFLIGDRITDIQSGASAGIKHLFLIVNPKMLEVNENIGKQPFQNTFIPLKDLKEFLLAKELQVEN